MRSQGPVFNCHHPREEKDPFRAGAVSAPGQAVHSRAEERGQGRAPTAAPPRPVGGSALERPSLALASFTAGRGGTPGKTRLAGILTFPCHSRIGQSEAERAVQDVLPGRPDGRKRIKLVDTGSVSSRLRSIFRPWPPAVVAEASKPAV